MYNLFLTAMIGSVLIAGVAFSPLLSGQFHSAYAQDNATTMSGNMTGNDWQQLAHQVAIL